MTNANAYYASYPGMEQCVVLLFLTNPAVTLMHPKQMAEYFKVSEYSFRKKMREYGAYTMKVQYIMNRTWFPNKKAAQKFIDEYVSHLILADDMAKTGG